MNELTPKTDKGWPAFAAEFLVVHVLPLNEEVERLTGVDPEITEEVNIVIGLLYYGKITTNTAKKILRRFWIDNIKIEDQYKEEDFLIIDDPQALYHICLDVIEADIKLLNRCRENSKATGALIGAIMRKTGGKADSEWTKRWVDFFIIHHGAIDFKSMEALGYYIEGLTN